MTNLETISYYEKLHDLFENVAPRDMPMKLEKLVKFLTEGSAHLLKCEDQKIEVSDVVSQLQEMRLAFTASLARSNRSLLLCHQERNYEVNLYPIIDFLRVNRSITGDMADLKARMVSLVHSENIGLFKTCFLFVDLISVLLASE
jgi:hypothetical protein